MTDGAPFDDVVVGLDRSEAALIVHLLVTFERLLRQGVLTDAQLEFLVPPGSGPADSSADLEIADTVATAVELLERQL